MRLLAFAGKFALFLAVMSFLTAVSLFVGGAFLATWPLMHISPRNRRLQSLFGLAVALLAVARAYDLESRIADTEDTEDTETTDEPPEGWSISDDGETVTVDGRQYRHDVKPERG